MGDFARIENYNECLYKEWYADVDPEWVKLEPDYPATQTLTDVFREAVRQQALDAQADNRTSG